MYIKDYEVLKCIVRPFNKLNLHIAEAVWKDFE
jgi:hypothetical protein